MTKMTRGSKDSLEKRKYARKMSKEATKSAKLGSGKRFGGLMRSVESEGYSKKSAGAIAASIGRKKYGNKKMSYMAAKGRK